MVRRKLAVCAALTLFIGSHAVAETVAVLRGPHVTWIVLKNTINGPSNSRGFTAFQLEPPALNGKGTRLSSLVFVANCPEATLAWTGGLTLNDDFAGTPILPPGGPSHRQVFSIDSNPIWRQMANAACGLGSTDWIDVSDIRAFVKQENLRAEGGN
jgi:hypothetical protein